MLINAFPANATPLPANIIGAEMHGDKMPTGSNLPAWAASIGRTTADVAALMFHLPLAPEFRPVFEDTIRREVAAELLGNPAVSDDECQHLEDIAWLAFDHRISNIHHITSQSDVAETATVSKFASPGGRSRGPQAK